MKKLIALVLLTVSASAMAQHHHGHHGHGHWHRGYSGGWNWVPALIIGGVAGAAIANSNRPVDPPPTVIVQQPPVIVQQENCTLWREVQTPDGKIYRERTCTQ
jgi:hypothetical protein